MSAVHTPGPWIVVHNVPLCNLGYRAIVADNGPDAEFGRLICNPSPMGTANARLIAAAPDLLAALQALVGEADLGELDHDDDTRALLDNARAAIERATGVPV